MPILHLGVIDLPYVNAPSKRQRKVRADTVTTGQVAQWLENDYHIMEIFLHVQGANIAQDLEVGIKASLESLLMGAPASLDPFGAGTSKIEDRFKAFLSNGDMEKLGIPNVPTQAAIDRKSGRFKKGRGNKSRPSFIASGTYQSSFKSWVT